MKFIFKCYLMTNCTWTYQLSFLRCIPWNTKNIHKIWLHLVGMQWNSRFKTNFTLFAREIVKYPISDCGILNSHWNGSNKFLQIKTASLLNAIIQINVSRSIPRTHKNVQTSDRCYFCWYHIKNYLSTLWGAGFKIFVLIQNKTKQIQCHSL